MTTPTNLTEALALLTRTSNADLITGEDQRDVLRYIDGRLGVALPAGAEQVLPDADTTLTSARRAVRTAALTANRADTLPDGTTVGERRTVERTLASASGTIFRNRVMNSDGSVAAWLNGPGQVELAWDGTRWAPVGNDIKERVLTPYDFGGRGDGSTDDAVALQAWLDALAIVGQPCVGVLPIGDWRTTVPLRLLGGGDNYHSVRIVGRSGRAYSDLGSRIYYDGAASALALFTCVGLVGSTFDDIRFDANGLAKYALLAHIEDAIDESSSGLVFVRCSFRRPRDIAGAKAAAFGPVAGVPGTQTDTVSFLDCKFSCTDSGTFTNGDCFGTLQTGNTKDFSFTNCQFEGGRRGIDWELSSGNMNVLASQFGACDEDIVQGNGGVLFAASLQSERSGRAFRQIGTGGSATISQWEWHGGRNAPADDFVVVGNGGRIHVSGSTFINYRGQRDVTEVNTTTNVVTFNGDEDGATLANGEIVELRSLTTLPAISGVTYVPGTRLYVIDTAVISAGGPGVPGIYSCKLSLTSGGAEVDFTDAGSGAIRLVSPPKVSLSGTQTLGSNVTASFVSEQNHWDCAVGRLPAYEGANELLGPTYAVASTANGVPTEITSLHDTGDQAAAKVRLANYHPRARQAELQCSPAKASNVVSSGVVGTGGWHVEDFDCAQFFAASNFSYLYITVPARAHIEEAFIEIVTPAVYAGSTVTGHITDAYAGATGTTILGRPYPIATCDLKAAAGTIYGEDPAQLGVGLGNGLATLTDNSAGTANDTIQAMADPTDTPVTADALRDDLVANLLPAVRNNIADLTAKVNALLGAYRKRGFRPSAAAWGLPWLVSIGIATIAGTVGNGTVSNITAGRFRVSIRYSVPPRSGS